VLRQLGDEPVPSPSVLIIGEAASDDLALTLAINGPALEPWMKADRVI
jgi:hypothetical protein